MFPKTSHSLYYSLGVVRKLFAARAYLVSTNCPTENALQLCCGAEFREAAAVWVGFVLDLIAKQACT